ncbi:MAG: hypothetical protein N0C91_12665 [Candidatus Thiodiazotropha endolucinida]|nr:hypothetical protein [Candidatus Thiodiazotropha taylori]MCW4262032.1 hypothetical protein [Candidatus Thiodiazotropha endolucinida]MCG7951984.1 hypothetical protein [Candidatus Thiodiazotropha taylori]MCG8103228.1 hypothetical protein [Candidatus Thiodiazotropha taylori]MCG8121684.1 hypothetical protein [Candidatus Thiodiazotropha taylori]
MIHRNSIRDISLILFYFLVFALPSYASASSTFSFDKKQVPQNKPKAAVIVVRPENSHSAQYTNDLMLSLQNELLINGMDIVIGKENATNTDTVVMYVDFSIERGLLSHVRTESQYIYFVENISRVTFTTSFSTITNSTPFIEMSLSLDTQILGLTDTSYDSIETINSLFSRSANLMANLVFAAFTDTSNITGTWHDMLGPAVVEFPENKSKGKYIGYVKKTNQNSNGFSIGENTYHIGSNSNNTETLTGELKVRYNNGKEPEWLPAEFIFIGNLMIIIPSSSKPPVGMNFYIKRSQRQAKSLTDHTNIL